MSLAAEDVLVEDALSSWVAVENRPGAGLRTPEELAEIVSEFAASEGWMERVRLRTKDRWYERLYYGPGHDIWAISWMPGQSTGFHDHGESSGAFVVVTGSLEEHHPDGRSVTIQPGVARAFGRDYLHDVRNTSLAPAVSIHAYSPPLNEMNEYELDGSELVPREVASERVEALGGTASSVAGGRTIEQVLLAARARLRRLSADEAYEAVVKQGAIIVDIRPSGQREIEGVIPGALIVERNVLEWRFDPASDARLPVATDHDVQVVVFCSEGYTSSLAAAALKELGLWRATDVVGGFAAWRAAGLPVAPRSIEGPSAD